MTGVFFVSFFGHCFFVFFARIQVTSGLMKKSWICVLRIKYDKDSTVIDPLVLIFFV
jgi:hypothetical protein